MNKTILTTILAIILLVVIVDAETKPFPGFENLKDGTSLATTDLDGTIILLKKTSEDWKISTVTNNKLSQDTTILDPKNFVNIREGRIWEIQEPNNKPGEITGRYNFDDINNPVTAEVYVAQRLQLHTAREAEQLRIDQEKALTNAEQAHATAATPTETFGTDSLFVEGHTLITDKNKLPPTLRQGHNYISETTIDGKKYYIDTDTDETFNQEGTSVGTYNQQERVINLELQTPEQIQKKIREAKVARQTAITDTVETPEQKKAQTTTAEKIPSTEAIDDITTAEENNAIDKLNELDNKIKTINNNIQTLENNIKQLKSGGGACGGSASSSSNPVMFLIAEITGAVGTEGCTLTTAQKVKLASAEKLLNEKRAEKAGLEADKAYIEFWQLNRGKEYELGLNLDTLTKSWDVYIGLQKALLSSYNKFSGLGRMGSLFLTGDNWVSWRNEVSQAFCDSILFGGKECWVSKVCDKYIDTTPEGSALIAKTPQGTPKGVVHLEAEKSLPIEFVNEAGQTQKGYIYKITYTISNPNNKKMTYNLQFNTGTITYPAFQPNKELAEGATDGKTGSNAKFPQSFKNYKEVCLIFNPSIETWNGKSVNKFCTPISQYQGAATNPYTNLPKTEGTCDDGIQNQKETSTDCGGPCPACGTPQKPKEFDGF